MVGKKKRVKAMGGGKMGKRVKAMGGKKVGMGKRVKAKRGTDIKTETSLERKIRLGTKRMGPGKKRDERVREIRAADRAAKNDESASKFYTDNPDMIEKHAKTGSVGLFGANKDLTDDMLRRDYKSGGGKMKKVGKRVKAMGGKKVGTGKRVKARGGNKIKKLAKGTAPGGIGAAASAAAEKESKDKGTKRGATSIASVNKMDRNKLKALLLEMLRQKNN